MARHGLTRRRTLVQLRRPLPLDAESRRGIADAPTRSFRVGADEDDWLEVNNAAFDWHPEQGGWDRSRLASALAEDWVDLDGFLVHEGGGGRLDGFCWTKVHAVDHADPDGGHPLGEIWVIATHPRARGSGLGPALVAAGLDHLRREGLDAAMLYTEQDNVAARRMYERMGFEVHERRAGYG